MTAYAPACAGTTPTGEGLLCLGAQAMCADTPAPDDLGYWVYTAPAGPPAPGPDDWVNTGRYVCRGPAAPGAPGQRIVLTERDFRRLPLPAGTITIQPPNRRTLVNIPTNLYTRAATLTLPTTILGQPVTVRATTATYRWTYGDTAHRTTTNPGGPYPNLSTAHTYTQPGTITLTLATTYTGEYSVNGQPWQPITGTATVTSPPAQLTIITAHAHLVTDPL